MQTPTDGGHFCSLAISQVQNYTKGTYIYTDDSYAPSAILTDDMMWPSFQTCSVQILALPLAFLKAHVESTTRAVMFVANRVAAVESVLAERRSPDDTSIDFGMLTSKLHEAESEILRLGQRAKFEANLMTSIFSFMEGASSSWASGRNIHEHMGHPLTLPRTMIEMRKDNLDAIPQRIASQRTMVRLNLRPFQLQGFNEPSKIH